MNLRITNSLGAMILMAAGGCIPFGDPGGPGATGTISLAAKLDPAAFQTLVVRAFPDDGPAFDPTASASSDALERSEPLTDIHFPYRYKVAEALGTTDKREWRMVAWLSHGKHFDEQRLEAKDPFCTARFTIDSCGSYGGFCGVSGGVDCTLTPRAP